MNFQDFNFLYKKQTKKYYDTIENEDKHYFLTSKNNNLSLLSK